MGRACSGHGLCLDGAQGTGQCLCDEGYVGVDCGTRCVEVAGAVCAGHGTCKGPLGLCRGCLQFGLPPLVGGSVRRPGPGLLRSDRRLCLPCRLRRTGLQPAVPRLRRARLQWPRAVRCGGRTLCMRHPMDGRGLWRMRCGMARAGVRHAVYHRTVREPCDAGWVGLNCSRECEGGALLPCAGHGRCNDTALGDGACACDAGWWGTVCDRPCPGMVMSGVVCTGHGSCQVNGTCACAADPVEGYWAGPECATCIPGYRGLSCHLRCPSAAGAVCGGHWMCTSDTATCQCMADSVQGTWDVATNCSTCAPGYWGLRCAGQCHGGSCAPCSGHGVCNNGLYGDGTCACDSQWEGRECDRCSPGWAGAACSSSCPRLRGRLCAGHGVCGWGVTGTGACECLQTDQGMWGGVDCSDCLAGHWGPACRYACPADPAGRPCAGHGQCRAGRAGDGRCVCAPGYAGAACTQACPRHNGAVCNDVGLCNMTTVHCHCPGQWQGPACGACASPWVGPRCDLCCPTDAAQRPCAGAGVCQAATNPTQAECVCAHGTFGAACENECPGGVLFPCSGHGRCNPSTGACECDAGPMVGYWDGADCRRCRAGWSGDGCHTPCVRDETGRPCAGYPCVAGHCYCGEGRCGDACNVTGGACNDMLCPTGYYGVACAQRCPGGGDCSGHGECHTTIWSRGDCRCSPGFAGLDCSKACPGGAASPCTGHGTCDTLTAQCRCAPGYALQDCAWQCPITEGRACGSHGHCNDTAAGDSTCACTRGYAGLACETLCPGYHSGASRQPPCGGHGQCLQFPVACACAAHWAGEACTECASGWFGPGCQWRCLRGGTQGRTCVCDPGFATADCSAECPGTAELRCSGHGLCLDGQDRSGGCSCATGWYGVACSVWCDAARCFGGGRGDRAQCNPSSGHCECRQRFTEPNCTRCAVGYWGAGCERECECGGHGTCGALDGECECFQDSDQGFWAGIDCAVCTEGYLPPDCKQRNWAISRAAELRISTWTGDLMAQGVTVVDEHHRLLYVGGLPLLVYDVARRARVVASVPIGGVIRSGIVRGPDVCFLVEDPVSGSLTLAFISRGPDVVYRDSIPVRQKVQHRRRAVRPQGTAPAQMVAQVFEVRGTVYAVTVASGTLHVIAIGSDAVSQQNVSETDLQLHDVRSVRLSSVGGNHTLLLAGAWYGEWQLTAVPLGGAARPLRSLVSLCTGPEPCLAASAIAATDTVLYVALEAMHSVVLTAVATATWTVLTSRRISVLGMFPQSRALVFDGPTNALYVSLKPLQQPSVVYKLHASDLTLYGQVRLRSRGSHPEVVHSLSIAPALRAVYAYASHGDHPMVLVLLAYSVTQVEPELTDAAGGALLRVGGEGFAALGPAHCHFTGGQLSPATLLSTSTLQCHAPPTAVDPSGGCWREAVEVQLLPELTSQSHVLLRRIATPTVVGVSPGRGYYTRGQWLQVQGYGFVESRHITCRFVLDDRSVDVAGAGAVRFVSGTELWCRAPEFAADMSIPRASSVEVSMDGQIYSQNRIPYVVIGPPQRTRPSLNTTQTKAAAISWIQVRAVQHCGGAVAAVRSHRSAAHQRQHSTTGISCAVLRCGVMCYALLCHAVVWCGVMWRAACAVMCCAVRPHTPSIAHLPL